MTDFAIDVAGAVETADPGATSGKVKVYTKDVAGITHAYAVDGNGVVQQLTPVALPASSTPLSALGSLITLGPHTGLAQATAQKLFDFSTITLTNGQTYKMRGHYSILWAGITAGTTMSLLFAGSATFTSFEYLVRNVRCSTTAGLIAQSTTLVSTTAATICTTASTELAALFTLEGRLTVSTGGTFIPQFLCASNPGQVPTIQASSYLELIPLGAGFTQQGGWT